MCSIIITGVNKLVDVLDLLTVTQVSLSHCCSQTPSVDKKNDVDEFKNKQVINKTGFTSY